uniref:Uncharacterized protein n=1 Tax=Ascaris lumbricoides TaxID=6252 RepID=A0A0M3HXI6_ASCLU
MSPQGEYYLFRKRSLGPWNLVEDVESPSLPWINEESWIDHKKLSNRNHLRHNCLIA